MVSSRRAALDFLPWRRIDRLLRRAGAGVTFSQEGEDRLLERLLEPYPTGLYVDVGAHDPVRFSNTMSLYLRGWSGVVVEPMLEARARFERVRPRDVFVPMAIGTEPGPATFYEFDEPALNTLERDVADGLVEAGRYRLARTTEVTVRRLGDVLAESLISGWLGVMSVDCEGRDLDVLRSNDWERFRPQYVCCEASDAAADAEIDAFLQQQRYARVAMTLRSRIYELRGA
jgi:FkbM family methyltransferase